MKLIQRIVSATIALFVGLGLLSTILPRLIPSLVVLAVLVIAVRVTWFFTGPRW